MVDFKQSEEYSLILKFLEIFKMMHRGIPFPPIMVQVQDIHTLLLTTMDSFIFLEGKSMPLKIPIKYIPIPSSNKNG